MHRRWEEPTDREKQSSETTTGAGDSFRRFAHGVAHVVGTPGAFLAALGIILAWSVSGPVFHFSDTWQLVINTGTTIVTFLMVFVIQSTQNRDSVAIQLKLDELIRANQRARNGMVALESLSERELRQLEQEFEEMRVRARSEAQSRATTPQP
jgi:low affinity Fe/Cu permease